MGASAEYTQTRLQQARAWSTLFAAGLLKDPVEPPELVMTWNSELALGNGAVSKLYPRSKLSGHFYSCWPLTSLPCSPACSSEDTRPSVDWTKA